MSDTFWLAIIGGVITLATEAIRRMHGKLDHITVLTNSTLQSARVEINELKHTIETLNTTIRKIAERK